MRIGILTQWYAPEPGPAALPATLAEGLAERGHDVQVVTGFPNYPMGRIAQGYRQSLRLDEMRRGAHVRRVALYPSHGGSQLGRLINYASFAGSSSISGISAFDHIEALWLNYSPVTVGVPMFLQRLLRRTPTVLHALDLWPDTLFASGFASERSRTGRAVRGALEHWCNAMYRSAETVAYISPTVGEILSERGVPAHKLVYAPMWADETTFRRLPTPGNRAWGLKEDEIALVYAGTLGGAQDLDTLIEACALMKDLNLSCLIAGSGTHEDRLRDLASQLGATNVTFIGRLEGDRLGDLMAAGDIHYVGLNNHPLAKATMPSKIQAILASARPIVGSLDGDAARTVEASKAGWVVPPGNAEALAHAVRSACAEGRAGLAVRGTMARDFYDAKLSARVGIDRIEGLLTSAASRGIQ